MNRQGKPGLTGLGEGVLPCRVPPEPGDSHCSPPQGPSRNSDSRILFYSPSVQYRINISRSRGRLRI